MAHRTIPDEAVQAGTRAHPLLMRAFRDNLRAAEYYAAAVALLLDAATGHVHGTGSVARTANFAEYIETKTGVNDRVPFRFGGGSYAAANYSPTLSAGLRSFPDHATAVQLAMRSAVDAGSPASVPLTVTFDITPESKTRSRWIFAHTGGSDSPNTRAFELHFATGSGAAAGLGPSMQFAKRDQKKSFSYVSTGGFIHGYLEEAFSLGQGGLLESGDFVSTGGSESFTTAKFENGVVPSVAFQADSVAGGSGGKIDDHGLTGSKLGVASGVSNTSIATGGSHTFTVTLPNGGAGRMPMVGWYALDSAGVSPNYISVETPTHVSGNQWSVQVGNTDIVSHNIGITAY